MLKKEKKIEFKIIKSKQKEVKHKKIQTEIIAQRTENKIKWNNFKKEIRIKYKGEIKAWKRAKIVKASSKNLTKANVKNKWPNSKYKYK